MDDHQSSPMDDHQSSPMDEHAPPDTTSAEYARRLEATVAPRGWRRVVDPQLPYRWNIRRMHLGRVLDIGCGVGRNLVHLGGNGVGVDHSEESVALARARGLEAFTPEEFLASPHAVPASFDALLCAHVVEHMPVDEGHRLLTTYVPYVRSGGSVVLICPQQRGQASDPTHVVFYDATSLADLARGVGLEVTDARSFPFPAAAGRWFTHNETIVTALVRR